MLKNSDMFSSLFCNLLQYPIPNKQNYIVYSLFLAMSFKRVSWIFYAVALQLEQQQNVTISHSFISSLQFSFCSHISSNLHTTDYNYQQLF